MITQKYDFENDSNLTKRQKRRRRYYFAHKEEAIQQNKRWKARNAERAKANQKRWRDANREKVRRWGREYMSRKRADGTNSSSRYYQAHRGRVVELARRRKQEHRDRVLVAYGGKCSCCGEGIKEFLTMDHVYNDGKIHRLTREGKRLYAYLIRAGFPKDRYQILCWNCNVGKRYNGGICPHKRAKDDHAKI